MTKNKLFKDKDINSDKTLSVNLEDIKNPMDLVDALTKRNEYHNRKPVPMPEDQEYRNAGITKEKARKNGIHQKVYNDSINYYDYCHYLFGYTNTLKMGWQISAVA